MSRTQQAGIGQAFDLAAMALQQALPGITAQTLRTRLAEPGKLAAPVRQLSVNQVAELQGVDRKTILRRIRDGVIPARKFGPRLWRINPADLPSVAS